MSFDARLVHPRVRRAMRILENDQDDVPSTAVLAKRVGLSPAHFSRLFIAEVGEANSAYGRRIRLDHSINRLRYDPAAIGEVAHDFGYESQAAFTRAFHEQFGASPRDYMARNATLQPIEPVALPGPVRVISRPTTALAARRFFGDEHDRFWRAFLDDLPSSLREGASFVGLSYDDPRVTPPRYQRYDCCFVLHEPWHPSLEREGLDAIELPGGLHGQVDAIGQPDDLRNLFTSLFRDWLPTRPNLAPEGDPLPIFFDGSPAGNPVPAHVAIRVRQRISEQSPNAALLGEGAGEKNVAAPEILRR